MIWTVEIPPGTQARLRPPGRLRPCDSAVPTMATTTTELLFTAGRYKLVVTVDDRSAP